MHCSDIFAYAVHNGAEMQPDERGRHYWYELFWVAIYKRTNIINTSWCCDIEHTGQQHELQNRIRISILRKTLIFRNESKNKPSTCNSQPYLPSSPASLLSLHVQQFLQHYKFAWRNAVVLMRKMPMLSACWRVVAMVAQMKMSPLVLQVLVRHYLDDMRCVTMLTVCRGWMYHWLDHLSIATCIEANWVGFEGRMKWKRMIFMIYDRMMIWDCEEFCGNPLTLRGPL